LEKTLHYIALVPPSRVARIITKIIKSIAADHGPKRALASPPHITLQKPFSRIDDDMDTIRKGIQEWSMELKQFEVHLKDFDCFNERTIFIQVESAQLMTARESLRQHLIKELGFTEKETAGEAYHPHLTVANRDLEPVFDEVWKAYGSSSFEAKFTAASIVLMRHVIKERRWEVDSTYEVNQ